MARLIVNPGSPTQWEIPLKPGINSIGRGFANDFKLTDVSVSGSHCQVIVENDRVLLKDLGSTNGTFVDRAPVQEAVLQPGQTIHLGRVPMFFDLGAPGSPIALPTVPALAPIAAMPAASAPSVAAPTPLPTAVSIARPAIARAATTVTLAAAVPPPVAAPAPAVGSGPCKYHPKTAGRYFCPQCHLFYCDLCVTTRAASKICRHCGTVCVPVQVQTARPASAKGFFARLPGVALYPFKGSGFFILLVSTIVITALGFISGGFGIFTKVIFFGYLFSFIQGIIHSTASEDEELPGWPAWDDLFGCFLRFAGAAVMAFGLPIVLAALKFFWDMDIPGSALVATMLLGCFYFPMALLAVAMKDTPIAANPLIVFPAILKAPLEYLITCLVLASVLGIHLLGGLVAAMFAMTALSTQSMSELFIALGFQGFWGFVKVYLLAVNARLLGLLYVTKKHKLGWF